MEAKEGDWNSQVHDMEALMTQLEARQRQLKQMMNRAHRKYAKLRGEEDEAYDLLQRAISLTATPDPQALCEAADVCIKRQDFSAAAAHLRAATGWAAGASEAARRCGVSA